LDDSRALNNNPKIICEYFRTLKEAIADKIEPKNTSWTKKGFFLG